MNERQNLKPFFKKNIWLLPIFSLLMLMTSPFIILIGGPFILRKEYYELISDLFYEIKQGIIIPFSSGKNKT